MTRSRPLRVVSLTRLLWLALLLALGLAFAAHPATALPLADGTGFDTALHTGHADLQRPGGHAAALRALRRDFAACETARAGSAGGPDAGASSVQPALAAAEPVQPRTALADAAHGRVPDAGLRSAPPGRQGCRGPPDRS